MLIKYKVDLHDEVFCNERDFSVVMDLVDNIWHLKLKLLQFLLDVHLFWIIRGRTTLI